MGRVVGAVLVLSLLALPAVSAAQEYDPKQAGHPLRVVAYVLHPAGVILDYLLFRPAWALGKREPLRTLFGVRVIPEQQASISPEPPPPARGGEGLEDLPGPRPSGS